MNKHYPDFLWGPDAGGLRLGISGADQHVRLALENVGSRALDVASHVLGPTRHLDWFSIELVSQEWGTVNVRFVGDRDESSVVRVHLEPGGRIEHEVNLLEWSDALLAGRYDASARYVVYPGRDTWSGELTAGPLELSIRTKAHPGRKDRP
jgi:hypothetical protein